MDLRCFWRLFLKRVLKVHARFQFYQFICIFIVNGRLHYKLNFQQYFNAFFKTLLTVTHRCISFEISFIAHSVKTAKYLSDLRACFQNYLSAQVLQPIERNVVLVVVFLIRKSANVTIIFPPEDPGKMNT